MFLWFIKQVSQYVIEGLERVIEVLKEVVVFWECFMFNLNINRKVVLVMVVVVCGFYFFCNIYLIDQVFLSYGLWLIVLFISYYQNQKICEEMIFVLVNGSQVEVVFLVGESSFCVFMVVI